MVFPDFASLNPGYACSLTVGHQSNEEPSLAVGYILPGNKKSPAENRGAFVLSDRDEDVPSLAGLAATYSSKP
jgi:hypothetical protein